MAKIPAELSKMMAEGRLTYRGWEEDVQSIKEQAAEGTAEGTAEEGGSRLLTNLSRLRLGTHGAVDIATMVRRQAVWEGDRAAVPGLERLDAFVHGSTPPTYPGWEEDVETAERYAVTHPRIFDGALGKIVRRQQIHDGTLVPDGIAQLDALVQGGLTYKGWEQDIEYARRNGEQQCTGS